MKKSRFYILCLTLVSFSLSGQELPTDVNVIPPSPNVAAINKFIDIPVSYYTGTPNISIPIFQLQTPQLSLPISLSYHASGLKVEEHASWVGAGWALNAGGTVSRTVRGLPDELLLAQGKKGYFFNDEVFDGNGIPNESSVLNCDLSPSEIAAITTSSSTPHSTMDSLSQGYLDMQPDQYHFSFPGGSGKFVFNRSGDPIKFTKDDVIFVEQPFSGTIPPLTNTAAVTDYTWKFSSPDGTLYTFKNAERTKTTSNCTDVGTPSGPYGTSISYQESSWHLTEMSRNGDSIRFEYTPESQTYDTRISTSGKLKVSGDVDGNINACTNQQEVSALRLSKIISSDGYEVIFTAGTLRNDLTGSHRLDNIQVKKDGLLVTQYYLSYGYFGANEKLKLLSVKQSDGMTTLPGYEFDYFGAGGFPAMTDTGQDFWGFYNGASNGPATGLLPTYKTEEWHVNLDGGNRNPELVSARIGTLERITYPTGGSTTFEFELHQMYDVAHDSTFVHEVDVINGSDMTLPFTIATATSATIRMNDPAPMGPTSYVRLERQDGVVWQEYDPATLPIGNRRNLPPGNYRIAAMDNQSIRRHLSIEYEQPYAGNWQVGGLRLKSMTTGGMETRMEYTVDGSKSSGVLFTPALMETDQMFTFENGSMGTLACLPGADSRYLKINSVSQLPAAVYHGSHIGYSKVTAYRVEPTAPTVMANGSTVYEYINEPVPTNTNFPFVPQQSLSHKNGKLKKQTIYKTEVDPVTQLPILEKVSESENFYKEITFDIERAHGGVLAPFKTSFCYACKPERHSFNTYSVEPKFHYLDKSVQRQFFDGNISTETTTTYTYSDVTPRPHFMYTEKTTVTPDNHIITEKVERQYLTPALITKQEMFDGTTKVGGTQLSYLGNLPSAVFTYDRTGSGSYVQKAAYRYSGNLLSESETFPGTGGAVKTAYIWNYNGAFPTAQVTNASAEDIAYTSFEADGGGSWAYSGAAFTLSNLPSGKKYYALSAGSLTATVSSSSKTYIVSYWAKDGVPSVTGVILNNDADTANSFGWKYYEKEVRGATTVTISGTGSSKIDEVRLYPKGALVTTMTYDPRYGMTSQTNPSSKTIYYEYDSFGRLKYVKDQDGNILKMNEYAYQQTANTTGN